MQRIRPFVEKAYVASTQFDTEFNGRAIRSVGFTFDGTLSGTATGQIDDTLYNLLGTPRIVQDTTDLIAMQGPDWKHLAAIGNGGYPPFSTGNANGGYACDAMLNFTKFGRGSAINIAGTKLFMQGDFGAPTDGFTGGTPAFAGTLRPLVVGLGSDAPSGFTRPKITQRTINLGTSALDEQDRIRFDQPVRLAGIMLRALDGNTRVDGLITKLWVEISSSSKILGGLDTEIRYTWRQARSLTSQFANWSESDRAESVGVVFIPLIDPLMEDNLLHLQPADSITLHFDTSSTTEGGYSAVTQGGDEKVVATIVAFSEVANRGVRGAGAELSR
tara:strand:- start:8431 stop:9423 length:993 start_codon:yes stop_codon:yes gene_type:complete